jgi:YegS/Rv2252/BmrU family lipid kinase
MRILLIVNPVAGGRAKGRELRQAMTYLKGKGLGVEVNQSQHRGHATMLARAAAQGRYDLVVACGGDGTVSEVANGLAHSGMPMGVLPLGTVNIWASEAGIPRHPQGAAQTLLEGEDRTVDLGQVGGRYFLLMAGVGLDGAVAQNLGLSLKKALGRVAYVVVGAWTATSFRGSRVQVRVDGQTLEREVLWLVVGNTRLYGGLLAVTPQSKVDDGFLDLCIFSGKGLPSSLKYLAAVAGGRHLALEGVEYRRCREVAVLGSRSLPIQADGDPIGCTPQTFRIVPGALRVRVPAGQSGGIFSAGARALAPALVE